MSREVRRVPLDFDWPLRKVWGGYRPPPEARFPHCPDCENGITGGRAWLTRAMDRLCMAAGHAVVGRTDDMHPYLRDDPMQPYLTVRRIPTDAEVAAAGEAVERSRALGEAAPAWVEDIVDNPSRPVVAGSVIMPPTTDLADLMAGLSGRGAGRIRDAYGNQSMAYAAANAVIRAAGLDSRRWGICPTCRGDAVTPTPEQRAAADAWEPTEPPTGDGWQLWETVSEGSPISPVFPDREGLIVWLTTDYRQVANERPLTRPQAEAFVDAGSSIGSGVLTPGGPISGEAAISYVPGGES